MYLPKPFLDETSLMSRIGEPSAGPKHPMISGSASAVGENIDANIGRNEEAAAATEGRRNFFSVIKRVLWSEPTTLDKNALDQMSVALGQSLGNSRSKLKILRTLYNLSFVEENRDLMVKHSVRHLVQELKDAYADKRSISQSCLLMVVGTLRNLAVESNSNKIQMVKAGVGDAVIGLCWLTEGEIRTKAMGTLVNLSICKEAGKLLVSAGVLRAAIALADAGDQSESTLAVLLIHNLAVNQTAPAELDRSDAASFLKPFLLEQGLVCLAATIAALHLVNQSSAMTGTELNEYPIIAFHDRTACLPLLTDALAAALHGTPLFGLEWNPAHVLVALSVAARHEPNRRRLAAAGAAAGLLGRADAACEPLPSYQRSEARRAAAKLRDLLMPTA